MKEKEWAQKALKTVGKYQYVLLVILVGVLLLLWPSGEGKTSAPPTAEAEEPFRVEELEEKLERALSQVEGAGEVTVVLTVRDGPRQVVAQDGSATEGESQSTRTDETVLLSKGSGAQEPAVLQQLGPEYRGALVVSTGGGDPQVRLALSKAVSALTGLGADKITICKGK